MTDSRSQFGWNSEKIQQPASPLAPGSNNQLSSQQPNEQHRAPVFVDQVVDTWPENPVNRSKVHPWQRNTQCTFKLAPGN